MQGKNEVVISMDGFLRPQTHLNDFSQLAIQIISRLIT